MTGARAVFVALLRGVNVGGHGKLAMADLRAWCADLGYRDVVTYIQSGNVVLTAPTDDESAVRDALEGRIEEGCGARVPVILRSADDLAAAVEGNPFLLPGGETRPLHVAFLAETPSAEAVASLDPDRSPPDRWAVLGRHVYLHYPDGSGRSKLTGAYLERQLGTVVTARNWNTTQKLLELSRQPPSR